MPVKGKRTFTSEQQAIKKEEESKNSFKIYNRIKICCNAHKNIYYRFIRLRSNINNNIVSTIEKRNLKQKKYFQKGTTKSAFLYNILKRNKHRKIQLIFSAHVE